MITEARAIEIATKHIADRVELSEGAQLVVREGPKFFVVEWLTKPVERGPDFDARVVIDRETGKVIRFNVGS